MAKIVQFQVVYDPKGAQTASNVANHPLVFALTDEGVLHMGKLTGSPEVKWSTLIGPK